MSGATRVANRSVTVLKSGNTIAVDPTTPAVAALLKPQLSFVERQFLFGREKFEAGGQKIRLIPTDVYTLDHKKRIVTSAGFAQRVRGALRAAGYQVSFRDLEPHPNPKAYEPDWSELSKYTLRHRQDEVLAKMTSHPCGRIDCPPGFGKTTCVAFLAKACRKARIHVVTKRVPVLHKRIYPELCSMLPDVGIMCSAKTRNTGARVLCVSAGMLHKTNPDVDYLIADEVHELAADSYAYQVPRYRHSRNFGLSASHDMRLDGKDLVLEGLFGPVILRVTYEEACGQDMVVPIRIVWTAVHAHVNPCEGLEDVDKMREGVWANDARNALIARDAKSYADDVQVLITVATLEHAVNLKRLLPDYTLVYRPGQDNNDEVSRYVRKGYLPAEEPEMTEERFSSVTEAFSKGKLKKAIATTVWNVGVDFRGLSVLIRADAGGPGDRDIQIPGRVSRLSDGKDSAVVHDYMDQFDRGFRQKAAGRQSNYALQGFEQVFPEGLSKVERYLFED